MARMWKKIFFVNGDAERLTDEDDWANMAEDVYYLGNWDDGAMKTGWQYIYVHDEKEDEDMEHCFYFNSNGKRFYNNTDESYKTKKVNGKRYGFDERGVMVYQWNVASDSETASPDNWSYFNSPEDGARVTKGWFKVTPPNEDTTFTEGITDDQSFDADGADDEDVNWYYADGDGNLYASAIKKIKGKYYAFAPTGKMLNGLVFISVDPDTGAIDEVWDDGVDADDLDDIMDGVKDGCYDPNATLYYFGNDADSDGAMKTGNVTVTVDGDSHNFLFSKTGGVEGRGRGDTGIDDDKYIYKYGKRIKADSDEKYIAVTATGYISDDNVEVIEKDSKDLRADAYSVGKNKDSETVKINDDFDTSYFLVNTSGSIVKNKTAAKDGDDWYFYVDDYKIKMYTNNKTIKGDDLTKKLEGWKDWVTPEYSPEA